MQCTYKQLIVFEGKQDLAFQWFNHSLIAHVPEKKILNYAPN